VRAIREFVKCPKCKKCAVLMGCLWCGTKSDVVIAVQPEVNLSWSVPSALSLC
jgi:uncharacterized FAD-dependent dehydrogenase